MGHKANEFKLFSVFWPLWISCMVMCICMILVIAKVFQLERATNRWRTQFETTTTPTPTPTTTTPTTTTIPTTTKKDRRRSTWTRNDSVFTWTIGKQKDRDSTTPSSPPQSPAANHTTTQTHKANKKNLFNLLFGKSKKSRKVVAQAFFFVSAFWLTWLPYMGYNLYRYIHQLYVFDDKFVPLYLSSTMMPAQGFFNFLVYMRPRYILYQEQRQHKQKRKQKLK